MLFDLIRRIHEEGSPEAYQAFADEFRRLADNHEWVAIPSGEDENGRYFGRTGFNGENWLVMFSGSEPEKCVPGLQLCGCSDLAVTDINKLIAEVYCFKNCPGILIDPQGPRTMVIPRSALETLTGRKDPWII